MRPIEGYRDLEIWRRGMELVRQVYVMTKSFPREELFALTTQMRRAAVAVPSNIAEGYGRTGRQEFLHFLSIAHGSLLELETQIQVAEMLEYVAAVEAESLLDHSNQLSKMIKALMRRLRST